MKTFTSLSISWILVASEVIAQRIDFEKLPDSSTPTNGMVISNQFSELPFGVSLQFQDGTYPEIAEVGGKRATAAFYGPPNSSKPDVPAAGQDVGRFFLSNALGVHGRPRPLIITYSLPVSAASGFILDVDYKDAWEVEARNHSGETIESRHLESHTAPTGDGIATPWSFLRGAADIYSIRISYSGGNANVGFAFDNFSPASPAKIAQSAKMNLQISGADWLTLQVEGTDGAVYLVEEKDSLSAFVWTRITSIVLPTRSAVGTSSLEIPQFVNRQGARKFFRVMGWSGAP